MKTTEQIKSEIADLEKQAAKINQADYIKESDKIKELNKVRNSLRFLRNCLGYLSINPREEFVEKMRDGVLAAQKRIEDNFAAFYDQKADNLTEMRQSYYAKENYSMLSSQLKMLNYIINK